MYKSAYPPTRTESKRVDSIRANSVKSNRASRVESNQALESGGVHNDRVESNQVHAIPVCF